MNSGLYDRAGSSATDSAAACAKRLDAPMTNWSKVYAWFSVPGAQTELEAASRAAPDGGVGFWYVGSAVLITSSSSRGAVSTTSSQARVPPAISRSASSTSPL